MTGPVPKFVRRRRAAQKLREAADLLATGGWVQGVLEDSLGRHCMVGAIRAVADGADVYRDARQAVREHPGVKTIITGWNDEAGRTAEEVIAVLRETAAEEDARAAALEAESRPDGELP